MANICNNLGVASVYDTSTIIDVGLRYWRWVRLEGRKQHEVGRHLYVVTVDVKDGAVERLGHVSAVGGAPAFTGVCGESNLQ